MTDKFRSWLTDYAHYIVLWLVLLIGAVLLYAIRYDHSLDLAIIIGISLVYFVWGLIHHYLEGDLHWKVVLEYFLFAFLGCVLVLSLFRQV